MATCLDYSLSYIHLYPKTEQELRTKLYTKKYDERDIAFTMDFLKKKWYVDDVKFTELYVQSEVVKKGKLPALVKAKLLQKWVDKGLIDDTMRGLHEQMQDWVHTRILKEIEKYKKKWLEGVDIIMKISQKWYHLSDIKKAIKSRDEENN